MRYQTPNRRWPLLLALLLGGLSPRLAAQDIIIKTDKEEVKAKVLEIEE